MWRVWARLVHSLQGGQLVEGCTSCVPPAVPWPAVAFRLIFTLQEYPTTEDFVYLRRFKRWPADCNPYALEVVQFADIDQANYYTMSVRGITHYIDGVNAEFASERLE